MKQTQNISLFLFVFIISISCCTNDKIPVNFTLAQSGSIVEDPGFSQGAAWADFDNDGDEDLFVTNSWTNGDNLFYVNNSDGNFTSDHKLIIASDGGNSNGCSWGDVNNDGNIDLFVANVNDQNNFFYLNNGDGSFEKLASTEATTNGGWSYTATWGDYNNDGWLDLFVGNYKDQSNFLYINNGQGQLERTTNSVIEIAQKSTQGSVWFDYDNDGDIDLYVCNVGPNNLYENLGDGTFKVIEGIEPVIHDGNSFGCSSGDYNNDGFTDIFVANWWGKNNLYKNLGNKTFEKITGSPVTEESLNSEGSSWGDFDNDGDLDLLVTNDGNNSFFENMNTEFIKLENLSVANDSSNSNGVTWNDYDNDGDLDIFIANGGNQSNLLYSNPGNKNNWLKVKCIGIQSNHSAIGAKITVHQGRKNQIREISGQTGGGYGAQNGLIMHFGLGFKQKIDSITIDWPSGRHSYISNPEVNKTIEISEG